MDEKKKKLLLSLLSFSLVLFLSIILFINRNHVQKITSLGYGGIFILSILTNATLILPLPGVVITSAMGAVFNPFWVAIAAGTGAALGETTGYLAGYSGQIIIDRKDWYDTTTKWMRKYGSLTILIMAIIPNPFFDLAGMAAGMLKLPFYRFLFWCCLGKIIKMLLFAYTGASIFKYFSMKTF
jgi:uncharacterized membrane protein YdjX (TVP38/TMEM64 family)